jgi:hypothetical protein
MPLRVGKCTQSFCSSFSISTKEKDSAVSTFAFVAAAAAAPVSCGDGAGDGDDNDSEYRAEYADDAAADDDDDDDDGGGDEVDEDGAREKDGDGEEKACEEKDEEAEVGRSPCTILIAVRWSFAPSCRSLMSAKRRSLKAADGLRATASSGMVIGMIGGEEDRNVLLTSRKRLL